VEAANPKAVVYSVDRGTRGDDDHFTIWRGCWKPTGVRTRIPHAYDNVYVSEYVTGVRLAGRFAAVAEGTADHYGGSWEDIGVYDLARGGRHYALPFAAFVPDFGCAPEVHLEAFVLNRRGLVGWTTSRWVWGDPCADEPTRTGIAVRIHDHLGTRLLDNGPYSVTDLHITRSSLTWVRDGTPHSAAVR
jgi:hypothetical protein